jgi:Bacterial EndoU nuclease
VTRGVWAFLFTLVLASPLWARSGDAPPPLAAIRLHHILCGDINRRGEPTGFHLADGDGRGRCDARSGARVVEKGPPDKHGVYQAVVEIMDERSGRWLRKEGGSTMFPVAWSPADLERELRAAYGRASVRPAGGSDYRFEGRAPSGILMRGFVTDDGRVMTAFPVRERGP